MPSPARHHAEWLSLLEISGPFLSLPVLLDVFPQGLEAHDSDLAHSLRAAHEEWADNQGGLRPDPAIHTAWMRYVLTQVLEFNPAALLEGQSIPTALMAEVPEHGIRLRPELALTSPEGVRLLIKVYPAPQELDHPPAGSRWKASVATQMMELLHATEVKLGLVTNGEEWMLVHAPKGETTGFISWYAHLWFDESLTLRAFHSLLGARRFFGVPDEEKLEALLDKSSQDQHEVTDQLGSQVRRAVEILIRDLDKADIDRGRALLADVGEDRLYEAALTVMMRLVFLLSAEERKLLPLDDPFYAEHYAISTLRAQLRELADQQGEDVLERRTDAWSRLLATFRAVYAGISHDRLRMIAYGSSLFDPDRFPFLEGRAAGTSWRGSFSDPLPVDNLTVLHLLEALQILQVKVPGGGPSEARRLSFRALDIEQIGHVYEGLLDHVAVRAKEPVLGLAGTKNKEPEINLSALETVLRKGHDNLVTYLNEQTGRSASALNNALEAEIDAFHLQRLRAACGNDEVLYQRILPLAGVVRDDDNGFPVVIPTNSVYVTEGPTRRATGTHYTPRSLTEPIVQHTLEPLVYIGPAEGKPREEWTLKTPEALLDLKVCDMAMGSGAFLVQVVRYLSERLVEAWELYGEADGVQMTENQEKPIDDGQITDPEKQADQDPSAASPEHSRRVARLLSESDDQLVEARRLVADRCIYGVDKNPLAVEMAKLSLWLITVDKNRPFTFLDHGLKCGDSLVGASEKDFVGWAHGLRDSAMPLFQQFLQDALAEARGKRRQLQSFQVLDLRDAERKANLLAEAEAAMARVKLGCDLLVGVKLLGLNQSEQDSLLSRLLLNYVAGEAMDKPDAKLAINAARKEHAFHWDFEFPEVFEQGGFSAFIGNPPFMGGRNTTTALGTKYRTFLDVGYPDIAASADLCSYFFRKGFANLALGGSLGLIATNTIAQGSTRESSLEPILASNGHIYSAKPSILWPGLASVIVSIVHIYKGVNAISKQVNDSHVAHISAFLDTARTDLPPETILQSTGKSFQGCITRGVGFILEESEAIDLLKDDPKNQDVIFRYLVGRDVNSHPSQQTNRWVINFGERSLDEAKNYPECFTLIKERVFEYRQSVKTKKVREQWWLFEHRAPALYKAIKPLNRVLVRSRVSNLHMPVFVEKYTVYADTVVVFAHDTFSMFTIIQSDIHEAWARKYSSTMKTDLRYTPTNCYETFPFPNFQYQILNLESIGEAYHEHRHQIMLARQEGLTKTYNRFHDSEETSDDIARLRELHIEMDQAVAAAYGWEDLELGHDFHETPQGVRFTISEVARREVLGRLLELNHQRYAEEAEAGLHGGKGGRQKAEGRIKSSKPKAAPEPKTAPKDQSNFLEMVADSPAKPSDAVPGNQIGAWDQCVCMLCGKNLAGFMVAEHTKTEHHGKDPGYRKVGK